MAKPYRCDTHAYFDFSYPEEEICLFIPLESLYAQMSSRALSSSFDTEMLRVGIADTTWSWNYLISVFFVTYKYLKMCIKRIRASVQNTIALISPN